MLIESAQHSFMMNHAYKVFDYVHFTKTIVMISISTDITSYAWFKISGVSTLVKFRAQHICDISIISMIHYQIVECSKNGTSVVIFVIKSH